MSNDKVSATLGGSREDLPYRTQAYAIGHAHGKGRNVPSVQDWMCAQRWAKEETQPTGERTWTKLTEDDLYQDFKDLPWRPNQIEYANPPKRGWTPTKGELGIAMGIVLFIIVIFCFIVVAY